MATDLFQRVAAQLDLPPEAVRATIDLLDDGATLPFIARYRKEATGGMDEEEIGKIIELLAKLRALDERREAVIASVAEQGKLTDDLKRQFAQAESLTALEDLYLPFRPKRRTRASIAREKGLQPLADFVLKQARGRTPEDLAAEFVGEQVATPEDALAGARDIVAETVSDSARVRARVREKAHRWGVLNAGKVPTAEDPKRVYELYYQFEGRLERLRPHQVMALNRGEAEGVLRLNLVVAEHDWRDAVASEYHPDPRSPLAGQLEEAITDAAQRLLLPAIDRDVRRTLTETAETHAIGVFAANLRALLNQPPLLGHTVIGLDPGYRTGCKVAVIDPTGKVLDTGAIFPHEPQKRWRESLQELSQLVERYGVTLIVIGNGTASRETERLVAELTRGRPSVHYLIASEAGASVYSASPLARAELPDLDVTLRGAVSIARRVQDPLAELVKVEPKAVGVGMYQHDVDQKRLAEALDGVVEVVVNRVGVDVNTASAALLAHVAGIGPKLAERIVAYRDENGPFRNRKELRKVSGLGPRAYEQSAGFLRVRDGDNPLDASAIHPESYWVAEAVLKAAGVSLTAPPAERERAIAALRARQPLDRLAASMGTGEPTLVDIIEQLVRPGRDPRQNLPPPILRSDVLSMDDLRQGMKLNGTVRNVVDFGAFVDIGVKQEGLLHRSRIPAGTALSVGDIIEVEVLSVESDRGRISLNWVE
ncbi:MAG: Tex family protein [Anaerolineae bacterium]